MTIAHHPDAASLIAYAAGSLGEALSAVVAAHLDHCAACRREVRQLEVVGGSLLTTAAPVAMRDKALERAMSALDTITVPEPRPVAVAHNKLATVERLLGTTLDNAPWRSMAPGVHRIHLPLSPSANGMLQLLRIGAGRAVPDHGHGGAEMTLILRGAYTDRLGHFGPGDIADLDQDVDHEPTVDAGADCICLIASEHGARFKGRLMRILQPILKI